MLLSIILSSLVCGIILLCCLSQYIRSHFSRNGVKVAPSWPIFGDMMSVIFRREHFKDMIDRLYSTFPGQKYIGVYQFFARAVMITDIDLIKQVAVKDFDHFTDHFTGIDESVDPIFGSNLFSLRGQKWRDMRATLSPAFTSSKMRNMFQFVTECAQQITAFYLKEMENPNNKKLGHIEVEMKDAFSRYANDVIASTAFGVNVDSLSERNNYFFQMGKEVTNFTGLKCLKFILLALAPRFSRMTGMKIFNDTVANFYRKLVSDSMKAREDGEFSRPDMIQLLLEAKKGSLKHENVTEHKETDVKEAGFATVEESSIGKQTVKRQWTDDQIVGQAVLFFIAGFDTSSSVLCFIVHELAIHPDIQLKLQEEIDRVALKNDGQIFYNDLQSMKYLDMVISETLRLWPSIVYNERKCVKQYTFPPPSDSPDQKGLTIEPGEAIWIPTATIHCDPRYFPNPEKFDPERFSDENKRSIQSFTYMPFGVGPRNCVGSRFALMEIKAVIFHLMTEFNFVVISKTQIPLQLAKNSFNMTAERGFWVGLKPRVFNEN